VDEPDLPAAVIEKPLAFKITVPKHIGDIGSRLMLAECVARGTLQGLGALAESGATDLRVANVRRTDHGIEIIVEGTRPPGSGTIEAPTPGPVAPS
jgi:hypothetical protein